MNEISPDWEVQTVLGRIPAPALGATDAHTHLIRLGGPLVDGSRDFLLDSVEKSVDELGLYRAAGGSAVVDMTPSVPGRDTQLLAAISRRSDIHVIAAAGFVDWALYPGTRGWIESASVDELAALIAAEVTDGCDANNYTSPLIRRTSEQAGVIKVATGYQVITSFQERLIRAAAAAHRMTGAPISAHTEYGTCVLELVDLLVQERVDPEAVIVAHTFHNPDPVYQRDIAQTGIYLVQDGPGRIKYCPESNTVEQIERFLADGFGDRLLLAGDHSRRSYWTSYGGGPGFDYLQRSFVPRMLQAGIPESAVRAMLVDNAARAFRLRTGRRSR
ncbi:MAG: phosphotriesterase [Planctomycetaceae bacterium]